MGVKALSGERMQILWKTVIGGNVTNTGMRQRLKLLPYSAMIYKDKKIEYEDRITF
ncbi:MAG: hypothetical protein Q4C77_15975 [Eubacteriales bacterium]|nr:hypothetical protein [Eubacteriales bacterium]